MSKISYKYKKEKITIANKLTYPETLNEQIYMRLSNGLLPGFQTVNAVHKGRTTILEVTLDGFISLKDYFCGTVSKKTFLSIVSKIIDAVKYCESNSMTPNNIDLDLGRIFIKPHTGEIITIYWPVVNNQLSSSVRTVFKELIEHLELPNASEADFVNEYKEFFKGITPFSLKNFVKMIDGIKSPESKAGKEKDTSFVPAEEVSLPLSLIAYDPFEGLAMSERAGSPAAYEEETQSEEQYPALLRLRTNEIVFIDSDYFVLGSASSCSWCIDDNKHISYNHAVVLYENESFFLSDMNSTNGTFIDGVQVRKNEKVRIDIGTRFSLADETFELILSEYDTE